MPKPLPKCILLPIDDRSESLKPVEFLRGLYTNLENIKIVVCYFLPPIPPVYREKPDSPEMARKRTEILSSREKETRAVLDRARGILQKAGFPEESILEHVQEKAATLSKDVCLVAGFRNADALVMQKPVTSLEGLLYEDLTHALLQHCVVSPVWLIEGNADPSRAAICVLNEETSLRAADHGAFMLAETRTEITLLHAARSVMRPQFGPAFDPGREIEMWLETEAGKEIAPYMTKSREIVKNAGISEERIQFHIIPSRGNVALEIIEYCRTHGIGIVVIGHSNSKGKWSFLQKETSVTKKTLAEFKDMAVWVSQ